MTIKKLMATGLSERAARYFLETGNHPPMGGGLETVAAAFAVSATAGAPAAGFIGPTLASGAFFSGGPLLTATGIGAAISGFSALDIVGGLFTIGSAITDIQAGEAQADILRRDAEQDLLNARRELLIGRQDELRQRKALNETLDQIRVAGFASGLTGSGSVAQAQLDAIEKAEFEMGITRDDAIARAGQHATQAEINRKKSGLEEARGVSRAVEKVGTTILRKERRG